MSFLSHGKNELFAGVEAASADDTYRNVDNLWNGYQKKQDEVKKKLIAGHISLVLINRHLFYARFCRNLNSLGLHPREDETGKIIIYQFTDCP